MKTFKYLGSLLTNRKGIINIIAIINLVDNENISLDASFKINFLSYLSPIMEYGNLEDCHTQLFIVTEE